MKLITSLINLQISLQFDVATEISVPAKLGICVSGLPSLHWAQVLCFNLTNTINFLYMLTLNNRQKIKNV